MFRLQHQIFCEVIQWLQQGERCWLATITSTYGSSPRPAGSIMACNSKGDVIGSLSGGCIEETLIKRVIHSSDFQDKPRWVHYAQNYQTEQAIEMPCGGEIKLLLEPLSPSHLKHFQELLCALEHRQPIQRHVDISSGAMQLLSHRSPDFYVTDSQLFHTLLPKYQLLIIGINPVSLYVAEMANSLDFQVSLCDPRKSAHQYWRPDEYPYVMFTQKLPDDVIREKFSGPLCAIAALAHDPRIDDMALMEALTSQSFYVGAMGSQKSTLKRKGRLKDLGINPAQLSALRAPIGLPIGSKTPMEIAISIAAELAQARNTHKKQPSIQTEAPQLLPA
ncbi:MAG: XdhC family protein [Gammaproteobacteria bacterium]|nr:XdhC family protein [Gammaproteobacteria bacterium]